MISLNPPGESLVKSIEVSKPRATTPPQIIPEMTFELIPTSPVDNPFRTSMVASPMLSRRTTGATDYSLDVQTILTKAKSLVSTFINLCLHSTDVVSMSYFCVHTRMY